MIAASAIGLWVLAAGAGLARPADPAVPAAADICRPVAVVTPTQPDGLVGIEDIEIDAAAGTAILSAHDRTAIADAVSAGADRLPAGGLYRVDLDAVAAAAIARRPVTARSLTAGLTVAGGFRPHGIGAWRPAGAGGPITRLAVVNWAHHRDGKGPWRPAMRVELFEIRGNQVLRQPVRELSAERRPCNFNDVAPLSGGHGLVTLDRRWCSGFWRGVETVLGLERAAAMPYGPPGCRAGPGSGAERRCGPTGPADLFFANGILAVPAPAGPLVVAAETRGRRLTVLRAPPAATAAATLDPVGTIALPIAPDNLTLSAAAGPGGAPSIWIAGFTNLFAVGMYRAGVPGFDRAGWAVWRLETGGLAARVRAGTAVPRPVVAGDGALLSAVTVAAVHRNLLLAGAAVGRGLLVCWLPSGEATAGN